MRLIILGAGGYGQTIADISQQNGKYTEILFLDDESKEAVATCADFMLYRSEMTEFYPAFGDNKLRIKWLHRLKKQNCSLATIVHSSAYVSPRAALAEGVAILPRAVVNTDCLIKNGCIINCGAIIDHGCVLDEGVHVCLGAIIKARNHIPCCIKIEAGQVIENCAYPL